MTALQWWAAALFWMGLVYCGYVYFGFFLLLALWAKRFGRKPAVNEAHTPTVSLLISAYNEERVIERKLQNALAQEYPRGKLEVCLVSDGSSDHTVDIARAKERQGVRIFHYPERRGKNAALNDAIPQTCGEILVFTDANTLYQHDAVRKLARHFADPRVGLVVGSLNFLSDAGEPVDGGLYWRYENRLKQYQSALRSVLVANGSIFAVRRELMGALDPRVANDFQTPMEVGGRGYDLLYEPEAVALEKSASDPREEYARKTRIVIRGMTGTVKLFKHIRGKRLFFFVSHKLLRWFVGYVQVVLLAANALLAPVHPVYAVAMAGQAVFYLCAAAGYALDGVFRRRSGRVQGFRAASQGAVKDRPAAPKVFQVPFYFCMVNFAAAVAFLRFLSGRRVATWEKAETAR